MTPISNNFFHTYSLFCRPMGRKRTLKTLTAVAWLTSRQGMSQASASYLDALYLQFSATFPILRQKNGEGLLGVLAKNKKKACGLETKARIEDLMLLLPPASIFTWDGTNSMSKSKMIFFAFLILRPGSC
ncbi:unnamed protein product, partial [Mesorhabditis belari]|uniref:Uncharacterized protein n=1 Tax=Mesorhabditis belari TaxID=2138241 RepID=A0AAF3F8T3_9BILA